MRMKSSVSSASYVADDFILNALKVRKALHLYSTYLKVFRGAKKGNLIFSADNRIFYLERYRIHRIRRLRKDS